MGLEQTARRDRECARFEGTSGELQLARTFAWQVGGRITVYSGAALKAKNDSNVELLVYVNASGINSRERYVISATELIQLIRENVTSTEQVLDPIHAGITGTRTTAFPAARISGAVKAVPFSPAGAANRV
jgi:hypothetical protein